MKFKYFFTQKIIYITVLTILMLIGGYGIFLKIRTPIYMTAKAESRQFIQEISVTGKVVAANDVNLSFQSGGKVAGIPITVGRQVVKGSTLAYVGSPELYAVLLSRGAQLDIERSRLTSLVRGARPEELTIAQTNLDQAIINLTAVIGDAYVKTDDSIISKTDILFSYPRSVNPQFIGNFNDDEKIKKDIELQRVHLTEILEKWRLMVNDMQINGDSKIYYNEAIKNLNTVTAYLNDLSIATASLDTKNNNLPQATIDQYKANVSAARSSISTAITSLNASEQAVKSAIDQLALKKAGSSSEDIAAAEASVKNAEANVLQIQAQIGNTVITAPFSGTITKVNLKVGQLITPSTPVISMISNARFEIESYIPEADIAKIKIGVSGTTTLDAYGDAVPFSVVITAIDLSETQVEGVATYKTTLQFADFDDRIRSGMTANIDLASQTREGVLSVPQTAIVSIAGKRTVYVLDTENNKKTSKDVTIGSIDNAGNIEIKSGLKEGDTVVINPQK